MTIKGLFKSLLSIVADFFYPPHCSVCDKYIEHREDILCAKCSAKILAIGRCPESKMPIKEVWRITKYHDGTREMIRNLKYNNGLNKLPASNKILERAIKVEPQLLVLLNNIDVAVAVPLHAEREKKRGYNQVEVIFGDWLNRHNVHMDRLLLRTKATEHLFSLSPVERRKQMVDAFSLADGAVTKVKGKSILILDDIFTTGTTMSECAKVLKLNGAAEIYGLALASDFGASSNK